MYQMSLKKTYYWDALHPEASLSWHIYNWRIFSSYPFSRIFTITIRSQIKHDILRGLFTITFTNYYIAVLQQYNKTQKYCVCLTFCPSFCFCLCFGFETVRSGREGAFVWGKRCLLGRGEEGGVWNVSVSSFPPAFERLSPSVLP